MGLGMIGAIVMSLSLKRVYQFEEENQDKIKELPLRIS